MTKEAIIRYFQPEKGYFILCTWRIEGVPGSIIPKHEYSLYNFSECLGSYGLLYEPGDFYFISATKLDRFLAAKSKKSVNNKDLENFDDECNFKQRTLLPKNAHYNRIHYIANQFGLLANCQYASYVHDFIGKYLVGSIGEPITSEFTYSNRSVTAFTNEIFRNIHGYLIDIGDKASIELLNNYDLISKNNQNIPTNEIFNNDRGMGIILTSVNVTE